MLYKFSFIMIVIFFFTCRSFDESISEHPTLCLSIRSQNENGLLSLCTSLSGMCTQCPGGMCNKRNNVETKHITRPGNVTTYRQTGVCACMQLRKKRCSPPAKVSSVQVISFFLNSAIIYFKIEL